MRIVIVTLDSHLASAVGRAERELQKTMPGVSVSLHAAGEWNEDADALARCIADIECGDIVVATMLFMEDHIRAVLPALVARREHCDAMVCALSAAEVTRLTRMGRFDMQSEGSSPLAFLKSLRKRDKNNASTAGARQMKLLRQLPRLLRFIPGTAQDLRAYFLTLQYWLAGSEDNAAGMIQMLVDRYADGPRRGLRGIAKATPPVEYPEVGLYHPRARRKITESLSDLPGFEPRSAVARGTVGLLLMRSYLLAGNARHYDGVIAAIEARGLRVIPAFASGLDARPAVERFFFRDGQSIVDAVVSLTGFSLVGGPAYNDASAAEEMLARLDVPYVAAQALEFQTLDQWQGSERGLMPVEATMMVAIPELDGATGSMVFGGRATHQASDTARDMCVQSERADMLARRVAKLVGLRRSERAARKVAIVLFNFPPGAGSVGSAAHLAVFESLHHTLRAMHEAGYTVQVPPTVDALRDAIVGGNAARFGTPANVCAQIATDDHVRREPYLAEIESQWGPAPGRQQSNGRAIFVLGEQLGNVLVALQPALGYEGDPMRLLFEKGFAPTHAFSAFYRYLREDFRADVALHFGTHGALEFMPGKQTGLSDKCWPDRLIGDLPNVYLYASNNPSEGTLAKRRSAATTVSYVTPPVTAAGLYRGLADLKGSIERWRVLEPSAIEDRADLALFIQMQAVELDLATATPAWIADSNGLDIATRAIEALQKKLREVEASLIPDGLHVVGEPFSVAARAEILGAMAQMNHGVKLEAPVVQALIDNTPIDTGVLSAEAITSLRDTASLLGRDHELHALLHALDGGFIRPAPGGDLIRTPAVLPSGRNIHGFDPFRLPSAVACRDGERQAEQLVACHMANGHALPESIAIVLWGTDNLKTEGVPIAQALALMGARPHFDSYGRLSGAELIPLDQLNHPRIDVVATLSGIFRDLLPLQTRLLADAAYLAASADEPIELNFIRKHALAHQAKHGGDLETAALRVFGNAEGAYGANVNHLIENGCWTDEEELANAYASRKGFAYGRDGRPKREAALLESVLATVDLTYQNLDSVELGITTVDHYFDTLGGISRAIKRSRGHAVSVYIGDQTTGANTVRTLGDQLALETRTRILNPKFYEGMLKHGYEGVRHLEAHVTNTMGWSATTGQVAPWVYRQITETFMLDPAMRERLAALNPTASAKVANRLLEAHERRYWNPEPAVLEALRRAGEELEDRLEGIPQRIAA